MKLTKCPLCKKPYLFHAIKLHIINTGKAEAHKTMKGLLDRKRGHYSFSSHVLLRQMPHFAFVRKNTKNYKKFEI